MSVLPLIGLRTSAHTLSHTSQPRSSSSDYFTQSTNTTGALGDPQAQLLERWKALGSCIFTERISWKTVVNLNRKLDQVENILEEAVVEKGIVHEVKYEPGLGIWDTLDSRQPLKATGEVTPPVSEQPGSSIEDNPTSQCDSALIERITRAVEQLRQRQREFKHFHDIAIAQTNEDARQLSVLKTQKENLQKDVVDDEAELTYLKLKLRIIEIQTLPYVPRKDHNDLSVGIERWKLDWADVDKRYRKRRWKRDVVVNEDRLNGPI